MVDIGDAVDMVAQATRAATLADTDGAMPAGRTDAAMQVTTAEADTRVVMPVAADIMAAADRVDSMAVELRGAALRMAAQVAAITVADPTVAEVPTVAAVTAAGVMAADTGNQH